MTPAQFIAKWAGQTGTERALYQQHFLDLCDLLDHPKPADIDKDGSDFCFEKGAGKTGGGNGWADVFKRGHFAIEYKGPGRDLSKALQQVQRYALALDNPPLLVVCDIQTIQIHSNFTNTVSDVHTIAIDELATPANLAKLKALFFNPEQLKPGRTVTAITEDAARHFAELADTLRAAGHEPHAVAHFLNQCLFACFAEDVGLLPDRLFTRLLESAGKRPETFVPRLTSLFAAMKQGGPFGEHDILWFNGGLFADISVFPLPSTGINAMLAAARLDWSHIDPTIFGTLFERGLDPAKRSQLGAHYTDAGSIRRILGPVVEQPLLAEWEAIKPQIASRIALWQKGGTGSKKAKPEADALYHGFLERLRTFRVLDPACGSGNFLYLALKTLKDLQHKVMLEAEQLGLHYDFASLLGPECVAGIELNPYAAELARVVVWIGEIQWMLEHGFTVPANPVLKSLDPIECRDALLTPSPAGQGAYVAADWPQAEAIVGNPPFLGGSKKSGELGRDYCNTLNQLYEPHVPGGADLVCYWFHKARQHIASGYGLRCGLVATQAIRNGSNRKVLDAIVAGLRIFNAWSDEPWVNEGAAVRVSLVCFGNSETVGRVSGEPRNPPHVDAIVTPLLLNGLPVAQINADLTAGGEDGCDLTSAVSLRENTGTSFEGTKKYGDFDVTGDLARQWLLHPNPHSKPNSDVVKPWANGQDVTKRPSDTWIIDFGTDMPEPDACLYELPYQYSLEKVKPYRQTVNRERTRRNWWLHEEARVAMRNALLGLTRFIVTPRVAKHRFFVWQDRTVLPDTRLCVIARADDATFGILGSRIHEVWSLANSSVHGDGDEGGRPTYNAKSCFETFPFPAGLTPADTRSALPPQDGLILPQVPAGHQPAALAIAQAAQRLHALRENWLNPPEWVERVPEVVPGYPDRLLPKAGFEAELKKRTLTNLYNARPAWLAKAHEALDAAVAAAYGWHDYSPAMSDEEILQRLLALNLQRSGKT